MRRINANFISFLTIFISLIGNAVESRGQIPEYRGFNPDDPPETNIQLTPYLFFGAQLEFEYEYQRNADLDTTDDEDFTTMEPALVLALSFEPGRYFEAYADMKLAGEFEIEDGRTTRDRATLEIEQAYILFKDLLDERLALQLGRQRFEDERQWLFDAELDGGRIFLTFSEIVAEFSVTRGGIVDVDLLNRDAGDKTNNYITYWKYNFSEDTNAATYIVFRDNTENEEESAVTLGVHSDGDFTDSLGYWLELAYVKGTNDRSKINGMGFDLGSTYVVHPKLEPSVTLGYAFGAKNFTQTGLQGNESDFNGAADFRYYGQLFDPELNNMSIFTAGAGINPTEETSSIDLIYHYYLQTKARDSLLNADIDADPDGRSRSLGSEIDLVLGYEGEDTGFAAVAVVGYFIPGRAFAPDSGNGFITSLTLEYQF